MSLLSELKRRNVIRAVVLYVGAVWALAQGIAQLTPVVGAPEWAARWFLVAAAIGFPFWVAFAWYYEFTPDGIRRESELAENTARNRRNGRAMDRWIIVVLSVAVVLLLAGLVFRPDAPPVPRGVASAPAPSPAAVPPRAPPRSIAVLPFANMSADPENAFFSDGVSEEILNSLARVDALQVVGRTSSFQFKGRNDDLRAIGARLGVANLLQGSVRREGARARITAQLVRASDGVQLWSQRYDRTLDDTLAVQLDIAEQVANALDVVLDDTQRKRMRQAGVQDVEAFIRYQKGWKLYVQSHSDESMDLFEGLRLANAEFARATDLEPDFSFAYYAQTDLYEHILIDDNATPRERLDAQRAAMRSLERAAATSPDAQQRELALAERQMLSDDWRGLDARIGAALALPGCSAPNWMPVFASAFGHADRFEPLAARVSACDPLNTINWSTRSWAALAAGNARRVLAIASQRRQRTPGAEPGGDEIVATAMIGRTGEAMRMLEAIPAFGSRGWLSAMPVLRLSGASAGEVAAWRARVDNANSKLRQRAIADLVDAALFGTRAQANRAAAALDARPSGGLLLAMAVTYCGCGAPFDLDATPGFKARLQGSGLHWPPPAAIAYPPRPASAP